MRSQKQSNRSPRPMKNKGSDAWFGGGNKKAFFPPAKPALVARKSKDDKKAPVQPQQAQPDSAASGSAPANDAS